MAKIDWHIQGIDITACNCSWGCPCQFMSLPTQGRCHAAMGYHIERGHFGKVKLDGLSFATVFAWPKAIHEGNGETQLIVDERANPAQREALVKIVSGEETEPGATHFNVFASTCTKVHPPMFRRLAVAADFEALTGSVEVDGVVTTRVQPIKNPITGAPSRARITMPAGFEFEHADVADGSVHTLKDSPITLQWDGRHAHLARIDMTGDGVVHTRAA